MFLSAGQPGNSRKVMASVAAARKVFRILRVRSRVSWRRVVQLVMEQTPARRTLHIVWNIVVTDFC